MKTNFCLVISVSIPIDEYGDSGTPQDMVDLMVKEFSPACSVNVTMYSNEGYAISAKHAAKGD